MGGKFHDWEIMEYVHFKKHHAHTLTEKLFPIHFILQKMMKNNNKNKILS